MWNYWQKHRYQKGTIHFAVLATVQENDSIKTDHCFVYHSDVQSLWTFLLLYQYWQVITEIHGISPLSTVYILAGGFIIMAFSSLSSGKKNPGPRIRDSYTLVSERLRCRVRSCFAVFWHITWLRITIVFLRVVYSRLRGESIRYAGSNRPFFSRKRPTTRPV